MAYGIMSGYALTTPVALGLGDHTYVRSNRGHQWGCFGRCSGGSLICRGGGNVSQADCLSQPNSEAGIRYGKSGVCHQMANRILYPSGQKVRKAKLYNLSIFTFGEYGLDLNTGRHHHPDQHPWPELLTCRAQHNH